MGHRGGVHGCRAQEVPNPNRALGERPAAERDWHVELPAGERWVGRTVNAVVHWGARMERRAGWSVIGGGESGLKRWEDPCRV